MKINIAIRDGARKAKKVLCGIASLLARRDKPKRCGIYDQARVKWGGAKVTPLQLT
jgi:hypothetical protein